MQHTITQRVRLGAELLDRYRPGWADEIDIHRLNLDHPRDCVLGQLYGEYRSGGATLDLRTGEERAAHGFDSGWLWLYRFPWIALAWLFGFAESLLRREERLLRTAWHTEILARRQANAAGLWIVGNRCRSRNVSATANHATGEC